MKKLQQHYFFCLLLTLCLPLGISNRTQVQSKTFGMHDIKQHKKEIGVGVALFAVILFYIYDLKKGPRAKATKAFEELVKGLTEEANFTEEKIPDEKIKKIEKKICWAAIKMLASLVDEGITKDTENNDSTITTALEKITSLTYKWFLHIENTIKFSKKKDKKLLPPITSKESEFNYKKYSVELMTTTKITYPVGDPNESMSKTVKVDWNKIREFLSKE